MGDQGKKSFGKQKGKYGQQWQIEAGKDGKPNKGKGKAVAYQWQQQNATNEWINDQGTKNGGHRIGWQPDAAHQGQFQGQQAQQIHGIAPPNQREAVAGAHADAFVRTEPRDQEQQSIPPSINPNLVLPPGDVSAQGHPDSAYLVWPHLQNQVQQAIADGDAVSEHELLDEAAAFHKGSANHIRAESVKPRSAPYEREER